MIMKSCLVKRHQDTSGLGLVLTLTRPVWTVKEAAADDAVSVQIAGVSRLVARPVMVVVKGVAVRVD